jgi:hypothetical protein
MGPEIPPSRMAPSFFLCLLPSCLPAQIEVAHPGGGEFHIPKQGRQENQLASQSAQPTSQTSAQTKTWKSLAHKYVRRGAGAGLNSQLL